MFSYSFPHTHSREMGNSASYLPAIPSKTEFIANPFGSTMVRLLATTSTPFIVLWVQEAIMTKRTFSHINSVAGTYQIPHG